MNALTVPPTAVASATVQRRRRRLRARRAALVGWLSCTPAAIVILVLVWFGVASTIQHSFTNWNGFSADWVGMKNYVDIFASGDFFERFRTNLVFLASLPVLLVFCVSVAVVIYDHIPGWRFFRSVYYIPTVLSSAVVGMIVAVLFAPRGAINTFLGRVGLESLAQDWLGRTDTALGVLLMAFFWQSLGQGVLVFLAGLSTISPEIIEAASVDGAGWWRRLFTILLPLLAPTSAYFLLTNVVYVLVDLFSLVYVTTQGGPGGTTTPVDYTIYLKAFQEGNLGAASALSVVLLVIVFACSWFQLRLIDRIGE